MAQQKIGYNNILLLLTADPERVAVTELPIRSPVHRRVIFIRVLVDYEFIFTINIFIFQRIYFDIVELRFIIRLGSLRYYRYYCYLCYQDEILHEYGTTLVCIYIYQYLQTFPFGQTNIDIVLIVTKGRNCEIQLIIIINKSQRFIVELFCYTYAFV